MSATDGVDLREGALHGRVVVVTGASRGLGAGLARRFGELGMSVAGCARSVPPSSGAAREHLASVDVTDAASVDAFARDTVASLGRIDMWVNNAGVLDPIGPLRTLEADAVDRALAVNVGGVINGTRAFARLARTWPEAPRLLANVSSGAATSVYEGWSVYGAAKAAVDHLTEIVAAEEPGLLCHAVAPGVVDTDMQARIRDQEEVDFPAVARFRQMKADDAYNSPAWVAEHCAAILAGTLVPEGCVYRVPNQPH